MPRKVYTEQFKRDAVAMFESNPDTSMRKVAEETRNQSLDFGMLVQAIRH